MGSNFEKVRKVSYNILTKKIKGDFSMNYIYGYLKKDLGEYVYIGQTINIDQRRKKHEQYDPFNQNVKEYYYPLSRVIRK